MIINNDHEEARMSSRKIELTKDSVTRAIESGAASLRQLWNAPGGKDCVGGGTARSIRWLVPEVDDLLKANRPNGTDNGEAGKEAKPAIKPKGRTATRPKKTGAPGRVRTCNPQIRSQMLCPNKALSVSTYCKYAICKDSDKTFPRKVSDRPTDRPTATGVSIPCGRVAHAILQPGN